MDGNVRLLIWLTLSLMTGAVLYALVPSLLGLILGPGPALGRCLTFIVGGAFLFYFGVWFAVMGAVPLAGTLCCWATAARYAQCHERNYTGIAFFTALIALATATITMAALWPGSWAERGEVFAIIFLAVWGALFLPRLLKVLQPGAFIRWPAV